MYCYCHIFLDIVNDSSWALCLSFQEPVTGSSLTHACMQTPLGTILLQISLLLSELMLLFIFTWECGQEWSKAGFINLTLNSTCRGLQKIILTIWDRSLTCCGFWGSQEEPIKLTQENYSEYFIQTGVKQLRTPALCMTIMIITMELLKIVRANYYS